MAIPKPSSQRERCKKTERIIVVSQKRCKQNTKTSPSREQSWFDGDPQSLWLPPGAEPEAASASGPLPLGQQVEEAYPDPVTAPIAKVQINANWMVISQCPVYSLILKMFGHLFI
jgi:hypothetical protein